MFENLSDRLSKTLRNISGKGRLTEDNIKDDVSNRDKILLNFFMINSLLYLYFFIVFY